jgi:signal transduction histidine kinase
VGRRLTSIGGWAAAIGLGAGCEYLAGIRVDGWSSPLRWLPDLLVGWVMLGCAAAAGARRLPLLLSGLAWFAGTVWPVAAFWHRGPLLHALLADPSPRVATRWHPLLVPVGYVVAVTVPGWANGVAIASLVTASIVVRHLAGWRAVAGTGWVAALVAAAVATPYPNLTLPILALYQAAVCGVAATAAIDRPGPAAPRITDLVVEVIEPGTAGTGVLQQGLRGAMDDPTLVVGLWSPELSTYIDPDGAPVRLPTRSTDRTVISVDRDGRPFAVLVHNAVAATRRPLVDAVLAATRLTDEHAKLQERLRAQVADLVASRRRLLLVADEERRRLDDQLRQGPQRTVGRILDRLREAQTDGNLARAVEHLRGTLDDMKNLAAGLYPRDLDAGLNAALATLASRCPIPTRLTAEPVDGCRSEVELSAYYTISEALTNAAKHSDATSVIVDVRRVGNDLLCTITDNGTGRADPRAGTGLLGVIDRVATLGGSVRLDSKPASGTRLAVRLPLDRGFQAADVGRD